MVKANKTRVLIADSRPVLRAGLQALFAHGTDFTVVGETDSGPGVMKSTKELKPNLLLLDSKILAQDESVNLLRELDLKHKHTRVLVLVTSDMEEGFIRNMWRSAEILPKNASFETLLSHISPNGAGQSADLQESVKPAAAASGSGHSSREAFPTTPMRLSLRERQVVELVSQGYKNKEIALRMFISEQTVKNHLHNIFDKLGISDRLELVLYSIHGNLQEQSIH